MSEIIDLTGTPEQLCCRCGVSPAVTDRKFGIGFEVLCGLCADVVDYEVECRRAAKARRMFGWP